MLLRTTTDPTQAVNTKDESFFEDLGVRGAEAHKERNINQVQPAATLGIAQQTLAPYEGGRLPLPASLLPTLGQELQLPIEELPGQSTAKKSRAKRGPEPPLARHMERISSRPKTQQKFVMQIVGTVLAQQGR